MIELYINGQKADVEQNPFTYTLQVNDMFNFDTREVSYSETIYLPTTPTNNIIFGFANEPLSDKVEAYKTHKVDYYVNGIPIVQSANGFLIGKRGNYFIFEFKDNSKELYTFLQNRDIKGVKGLLDDTANRTITNIIAQHNSITTPELIYLIANYGDDAITLNSSGEYLIEYEFENTPLSIRLDRVFRLIQQMSGFNFVGDFFKSQIWLDTYIASSNIKYNDSTEGEAFEATHEGGGINLGLRYSNGVTMGFINENGKIKLRYSYKGAQPYTINETGEYKITTVINNLHPNAGILELEVGLITSKHNEVENVLVPESGITEFKREKVLSLEKGENIVFYYALAESNHNTAYSMLYNDGITFRIEKVKRNDNIDVLLTDFALTDLFKEVFRIFSLTPIRDRKTGDYHFYTLNELVNAPKLDWSDKFVQVKEEQYHNNKYGKKNNFVYKKYDDENAYRQEKRDSAIFFNDESLDERKDFQSKFYSPLNDYTFLKGENAGIENMEFFVKELKKESNGNIKTEYKEKTARWHIFSSFTTYSGVEFKLRAKAEKQNTDTFIFASATHFNWDNLIKTYYKDFRRLMEHPYIVTAEFALSEIDIYEFSFFSRIYVEQLGGYFLPNKIKYKAGAVAEVEMIKIN